MASTFKVKTHRLIGASATTVNAYTVGSSTATTVIGLTLANRTSGPITADAMHNDGVGANGKDTFLIKSAPIPSGGFVSSSRRRSKGSITKCTFSQMCF